MIEQTKKEIDDLMHSIITTFTVVLTLDEGNEEVMNNDENSDSLVAKIFQPVLPRIIDLTMTLAFSGASEEDMDIDKIMNSDLLNNLDDFMSDIEAHIERSDKFLSSTSKENQIIVGKVVKEVIKLNGEITELEQKVLDEFCAEYNITSEELESSQEELNMFSALLNDTKES